MAGADAGTFFHMDSKRPREKDPMSNQTLKAIEPVYAFKRRFLLTIMVNGAAFTGLFEGLAAFGVTPLTHAHFVANLGHIAASLTLAAALWRLPNRFLPIAWAHAINSFLIFLSALYNMPADEMRFLWFFVQAGGTFMLIGTAAGWATVAATLVIVLVSRASGLIELSANGVGTFCLGLICAGAMSHAFNRQTLRYIADLEAAYRAIDHSARHDALTGLLNLAAFREAEAQILGLAERAGAPVSLLFMDIDRFKSINDRFGHAGGDIALVAVARAVREAARRGDIVARIGGEEIVVLLPETDERAAAAAAERIRAAIEARRPEIGGQQLTVTASLGWATWRPGAGPTGALVRAADEAMYRAKQGGRNRVEAADWRSFAAAA